MNFEGVLSQGAGEFRVIPAFLAGHAARMSFPTLRPVRKRVNLNRLYVALTYILRMFAYFHEVVVTEPDWTVWVNALHGGRSQLQRLNSKSIALHERHFPAHLYELSLSSRPNSPGWANRKLRGVFTVGIGESRN